MIRSSSQLLFAWRAGDDSAFDELVERHRPWLWRYARARLSDSLRRFDTSEDLVQQAFVHLLQYDPAFLPESEEQFRALVARILVNRIRALAEYAHAGRRDAARLGDGFSLWSSGPADRSSGRPERRAEAREEATRMQLALALLEPRDQQVIWLRRFEDLPFSRVAEQLSVSLKAATKRYGRAVTRLGRAIERLEDGCMDEWVDEVRPFLEEQLGT